MKNNTLVFIPVGGLTNRMRAIASVLLTSQRYHRHLEIIWFKDQALNTNFHSLFKPVAIPNVTIREATFSDYLFYDRPRKRNFYVPGFFQKILFSKRFYELTTRQRIDQNTGYPELETPGSVYIASFVKLTNDDSDYSIFKPTTEIQTQIDSINAQLGTYCIGVHIRRGDNIFSIAESPLELFFNKMDKELECNPTATFYLATDSNEVKEQSKQRYGERIILLDREADRLSMEGMQDAVLELYLLAATKKIIGSYHSTFALLASEIGLQPYEEVRKMTNPNQE